MSIEQTNTVDIASVDRDSGDFLLTISDHLPWDREENQHILLLQEKINAYLRFVESGEMMNKYPDANGRNIVINVVSKFPLSVKAYAFFKQAETAISAAGFDLRFSLFQSR